MSRVWGRTYLARGDRLKVEISGCDDTLSFTAAEDHTITRVDIKTEDKVIPKGTEILRIKLPKEIVVLLNRRLIEAIPQYIIVDEDGLDSNVTLTDLEPFLKKEQPDKCEQDFGSDDDDKYALLTEALIQGHESGRRATCEKCSLDCVVKDAFSETAIRGQLETEYGEVWNDEEVREAFDFKSFLSPRAIVIRKSDGAKGTLRFTHHPRFYFQFEKE